MPSQVCGALPIARKLSIACVHCLIVKITVDSIFTTPCHAQGRMSAEIPRILSVVLDSARLIAVCTGYALRRISTPLLLVTTGIPLEQRRSRVHGRRLAEPFFMTARAHNSSVQVLSRFNHAKLEVRRSLLSVAISKFGVNVYT